MSSLRSAATEGVNGPGAGDHFAAVRKSLGDEILLSGFDGDAFATNGQRVATLHHCHIFIVFMHMRRGNRGLVASPEGHLAAIRPIKNVTLDPRRRLATRRNLVCNTLHEFREIVHRFSLNLNNRTPPPALAASRSRSLA